MEGAKTLFRMKPEINVSSMNELTFRMACYNGHLEVAKWLLSIKPNIDVSKFEHNFYSNVPQKTRDAILQLIFDHKQKQEKSSTAVQLTSESDKLTRAYAKLKEMKNALIAEREAFEAENREFEAKKATDLNFDLDAFLSNT